MSTLGTLSTLGVLTVFSGLSLNLLLQFGIGIGEIIEPTGSHEPTDAQPDLRSAESLLFPHWVILFGSSFILWLFFTYVLPAPAFGFLESFLLLPAAMLVSMALELLFAYFFPKGAGTHRGPFKPLKLVSRISVHSAGLKRYSGNGLTLASVFLTLRLAVSPVDALVLCLGFSLGALAAALILREISRRSSLETAPEMLRGAPLTLISMGLLSLIFSSISAIFLRILGVF